MLMRDGRRAVRATRAPALQRPSIHHKNELEIDAIRGDLVVLHDHLLLFHPRAADVVQRFARAGDAVPYRILKTLGRFGRDFEMTLTIPMLISFAQLRSIVVLTLGGIVQRHCRLPS